MKLNLDPWQRDFLRTEGDKILCCGRQVGKTEICAIDACRWAVKNKNQNILMIAPTERQAFNLFTKTLNYLSENHLKFIKKGKDRPTKTKIELVNGTKIYCLPTGLAGTGIRGLTVGRLYVDEASRIPEEVWTAVSPMLLVTGGNMIITSTPAGTEGEFYRIWINKDGAYDSFKRFSITSEEVIRNRKISSTWTKIQREKALIRLEQEKARMSRREYAQEYLGEFVDDLIRYFPDDLIREICILKRPERINPLSEYFLGVDIARMGEDASTFEILEKKQDTIKHVENLITRKTLTTDTEKRIINLNKQYFFKKIAIDAGSGSLGVGVYDHLLQEPEIRNKLEAVNNAARPYDREGKSKGKTAKEDLYDNLRAMMERREILLLDDDSVISSLRSVQYEYVTTEKGLTRLRIFGNDTHVVEGLIRAAWFARGKALNLWIRSIKV